MTASPHDRGQEGHRPADEPGVAAEARGGLDEPPAALDEPPSPATALGRALSRRQFLRWSGAGLAVAGLGGLGLLSGCSYLSGETAATAPATTAVAVASSTTSTTEQGVTTTRSGGAPVRGGTLTVGSMGGCPQEVEPNAFAAHMTSNIIFYSLFDTLVRPKPGVGTFDWEMSLAEAVTMESPSAWTIRLREGASWHDGAPVTADDLIFSFRRALQPGTFASHMLLTIDPEGIEKVADQTGRTIRLNLTSPDSMLIDSLWRIFIVPATYDPARPTGSGPFKLQSLSESACTLIRHDAYWGARSYVDKIVIRAFLDEPARISALLDGSVDVATMIDFTQVHTADLTEPLQVFSYNSPMTYALDMNVGTDPLSDQRVRQALRYAADRARLVDEVFSGQAQIANDLLCPADANYASDLPQVEYDPERARALLQEAGAMSRPVLLSTANLAPGLRELALAYVDQAKAVGLNITGHKISTVDYYGSQYARRAMSSSFWLPQPLSVQIALTRLPESRFNPSRFDDEVYASLFRQARAEGDPSIRSDFFSEMQLIEHERGPSIVPVTAHQVDVYRPVVGGAQPLPLYSYPQMQSLWLQG